MGIFDPFERMSWNQSIASRVVTRASLSAKLESELEPKTPAIFGPSSPASFAYFDPESSCWKTSQATFLLGLERFSETWPASGTMRSGCVYERRISGLPTFESESSSWPTTRSSSGGGNRSAYPNAPYRPALAQVASVWPTAQAHDATGPRGQNNYLADHHHKPHDLAMATQRWPTARREDGESCGNHPDGKGDSLTGTTRNWRTPDAPGTGGPRNRQDSQGAGHQFTIAEQAEHWLTPHGMHGTDHTGKTGRGGEFAAQATAWQTPAVDSFRSRGGDRKAELGLDQQARFFPTPQASDAKMVKGGKRGPEENPSLTGFACSLPAQTIPDGPQSSENAPTSRRRLNPRFVEWLMGFPIGWTEL